LRVFRMAKEPAPALVATPHEAQKTVLDQTLRSKRQGVNVGCSATIGHDAAPSWLPSGHELEHLAEAAPRGITRSRYQPCSKRA
jgi:hypothetical protein